MLPSWTHSALRTLSPLLPNIFTTPLPPEIVSPSVSLHLFPSTHPHLPAVKGRVPYRAALWTAPVAWGCVPLVGNVKLRIISEKMVRTGFVTTPHADDGPDLGEEKLVVRWRTEKKNNDADGAGSAGSSVNATSGARASATDASRDLSHSSAANNINRGLSALLGGDKPIFSTDADNEFSGLFIISFDGEGRIASHTIEHADENTGFDKTSKVVTLTDWVLGKARWGSLKKDAEPEPALPGIPGLATAVRVEREERWRHGRDRWLELVQGCDTSLHERW